MAIYERTFYRDKLVESYLGDIREAKMLSDEEIRQCIYRYRKGDPEARRRLVEGNLRLVVSIAKRFAHNHLMFLDLIQEGNIGLMRSFRKFDPDRGFKFSTFASFWIKQEIIRSIENKGRNIRVPVNVMKTIQKMKKVMNREVIMNAAEEIDPEDLSMKINIRKEKVEELLKYFEDSVSLEQLMDKNVFALSVAEACPQNEEPEQVVMHHMMVDKLHCLLGTLTERERQVIELRYGLRDQVYRTHQEVARKMAISRERVRQLETRGLDKLRSSRDIEDFRDMICA